MTTQTQEAQQTQEATQEARPQKKVDLNAIMDATQDLRVVMAKRWGVPPDSLVQYVRSYISLWRGAPDGFQVPWPIVYQFLAVAKEHNLNPATKEIYGFYDPNKGLQHGVQIDGWITLANRQPSFDGWETEAHYDDGKLTAYTCRVYRKDRSRPTAVTVLLSEWKVGSNPNWQSRTAWMLEGKAIKQAIRYAFGFAGIQDDNDLDLIIQETEKRRAEAPPLEDEPKRSKAETLAKKLSPPPQDSERAAEATAPRAERDTDDQAAANAPAAADDGAGESAPPDDPAPSETAETVESEIEADALTSTTKVFVKMFRGKAVTERPKDMSEEDLQEAYDANEATLADPSLDAKEKSHALGVQNLLEAELTKRSG